MLEILERCRREGLVQIADNVKREPTYICNCCGCCCGQLGAINHHGLARAVTTSSFVAAIQLDRCSGCGKCARACPIQAIALRPRAPHRREASKKKMAAEVDGEVCLGCGVCKAACTTGSLAMRRREARVLTPESTLERVLRMAMGRGHLHDLLFDEHDGPTSAFANRLVGAIEALSLTRRVMLNETLQSRFVGFLCRAAQAGSRTPAEMI
jgi:Pyruvate/2-oxoacid:ferredoxin oxidoreductase delta subunit